LLITKRQAGVPVAYLTGFKEFYGRQFKVTPDVLIPRPDSELIIDEALKFLKDKQPAKILDIGTGSGCLIITLALETNDRLTYHASDISNNALAVAKENVQLHKANITFFQSNLLKEIPPENYDLIIANLPYLNNEQLEEPSIKFEPSLALDGGKQGLHYIKRLLEQIPRYTKKGSLVLIEIDPSQKELILQLLTTNYSLRTNFIKDLSGQPRLLKIHSRA